MSRVVILFARAPEREARAKGFSRPDAAGIFAAFAAGWGEAARSVGARLVVATPAEDLPAWRRLVGFTGPRLIAQRGRRFGDRLEDAARRAGIGHGDAVIVGGDVAPSAGLLKEVSEARKKGAQAVIAPAPDGGVSLLAVTAPDFALLSGIAARRRDVCARLLAALAARGRRIRLLEQVQDIDGRQDLRRLARQGFSDSSLAAFARNALDPAPLPDPPLERPGPQPADGIGPRLRAPPRAA